MLGAHGIVHARAHELEPAFQLDPKLGDAGAELTCALDQVDHERVGQVLGKRRQGLPRPDRFEAHEVAVRFRFALAALHDFVGEAPDILDQAELQHARPRPQLPECERRHHLVGAHETGQAVQIEARVAVADEFEGHGVHPGHTGQLAHRQLGKVEVITLGEVLANLENLGLDEVEVVEKPFRRRSHRLPAPHVRREDLVGPAKNPCVFLKARQEAERALPGVPREGVAGGQHAGTLLEVLDAEELAPERARFRARPAPPCVTPLFGDRSRAQREWRPPARIPNSRAF